MIDVSSKVFYQYKILVQLSKQISINGMEVAHYTPREYKNEILKKVFEEIKTQNGYIEFESNNHLISIKKEHIYSNDILAFKLAKKKVISITKKAETFVEDITNDYPYSLVFLNVKTQTFYVEKNYKLFSKPYEMNKILSDLLRHVKEKFLMFSDADFLINVILDKQEFLQCYNSFDVVNKVSLKLISPNSFLGNQKADELLNELREDTNTQETKIEISNNEIGINAEGFLKQFRNLFEYAVNGGGEWALQGKEKDKKLTKKSTMKGKTLVLNLHIDNLNINSQEVLSILEKENNYEED